MMELSHYGYSEKAPPPFLKLSIASARRNIYDDCKFKKHIGLHGLYTNISTL